jgi:hypothetical protein
VLKTLIILTNGMFYVQPAVIRFTVAPLKEETEIITPLIIAIKGITIFGFL